MTRRHETARTAVVALPNDTEFSGERKRVRCNELLDARNGHFNVRGRCNARHGPSGPGSHPAGAGCPAALVPGTNAVRCQPRVWHSCPGSGMDEGLLGAGCTLDEDEQVVGEEYVNGEDNQE